ncbi:MAG: tetratricopeptide repeat protein [Bacteroidales bacterium]|nr:tetratricopeptide repeat protein [Bacteroidales bacterium]MCF8332773.1 tetratricopeptide repeat protein [Bacteroidales bacterium]
MKRIIIFTSTFCWLLISTIGAVNAQEKPNALLKAIYLTKEEDYALALKYCDKAIEENAGNADSYYIRGYARYKLGKYEKAIKDFDTTLRLNKNHADAYLYRGNCKKALNKYWSALKDYKKARKIAPNITNMYIIKNFVSALFS